jgi:hypothetical protein
LPLAFRCGKVGWATWRARTGSLRRAFSGERSYLRNTPTVRTPAPRIADQSAAGRDGPVDIVHRVMVTDLHHFLDLPPETPGPARRLAEQLVPVNASTKFVSSGIDESHAKVAQKPDGLAWALR